MNPNNKDTAWDDTVSILRDLVKEERTRVPEAVATPAPLRKHVLSSEASYAIVDEIGSGGMGLVYRARQDELQRDVAIKRLHPYLAGIERVRRGFLSEAMITGRLAHPNVVPVYGISDSDDTLSISMKLVRGASYESILRPTTDGQRENARKFSLADCIEVLIAICNPISFAHSQQIIHRDIKPHNIMTGEFGEVLLLDWGLATSFAPNEEMAIGQGFPHRSQISGPEGSWAYMAPEMMDGDGNAIGVHSDVYLLGAVLYDTITGAPPHRRRLARKFTDASERDLIDPLPADVDDELKKICETALEKTPSKRYASVALFQQALKDYLKHQESRSLCSDALTRFEKAAGAPGLKNRKSLFREYSESVFGLKQALILWRENEIARRGLERISLASAELAFELGDPHWALEHLQHARGEDAVTLRSQVLAASRSAESSRRLSHRGRLALAAALVIVLLIVAAAAFMAKTIVSQKESQAQAAGQWRDERERDRLRARLQVARSRIESVDTFAHGAIVAVSAGIEGQNNRLAFSDDDAATPGFSHLMGATISPEAASADRSRMNGVFPIVKGLFKASRSTIRAIYVGFANSRLYSRYPSAESADQKNFTESRWYLLGAASDSSAAFISVDKAGRELLLTRVMPHRSGAGELRGVVAVDMGLSSAVIDSINPDGAGGTTVVLRIQDDSGVLQFIIGERAKSGAHFRWRLSRTEPVSSGLRECVTVLRRQATLCAELQD